MATFIMLPDGVTGTNEWDNDGGEDATADHVDNDNGIAQFIRSRSTGQEVTFTFANPSVDVSAISSITSVRIITSTNYTATSGTVQLKFTMGGTDGIQTISNGTTTAVVGGDNSYNTVSSDIETYAIVPLGIGSSTPWSYSLLEALNCKLESAGTYAFRKVILISYVYALVTYVEAGYGNDVMGVDSGDISKINGIATANIAKVNGV